MIPIDLSLFDVITPPPEPSQLAFNVTASGFVNLNEKLKQKLISKVVGLRINKDGTRILVDPYETNEKNSFKILNSGSIKAEVFTRELARRGIDLPARFEAEWDEKVKMWLGILIKPKSPPKSTPITIKGSELKRPQETGLVDMMP